MSSAAAITPEPEVSTRPNLLAKRLQSVVFFGALTLLLFGPLAFGAVEHWAIFTLQAGSLFLFIAWAFLQALTGELQLTRSGVFLPMVAFALLLISQLIFRRTAYQAATVSLLLLYCSYGLLCFLMVQCLQRRRNFRTLLTGLSVYGFLIASFALIQSITSNGKLYWVRHPRFGGKIYGPYVNRNHYAGLMELLFPFALVVFFSPGIRPRQKLLGALAAILMASTIFTCGSRGGMLSCAVQIAVLATVIISRRTTTRMAITVGAFLLQIGRAHV